MLTIIFIAIVVSIILVIPRTFTPSCIHNQPGIGEKAFVDRVGFVQAVHTNRFYGNHSSESEELLPLFQFVARPGRESVTEQGSLPPELPDDFPLVSIGPSKLAGDYQQEYWKL